MRRPSFLPGILSSRDEERSLIAHHLQRLKTTPQNSRIYLAGGEVEISSSNRPNQYLQLEEIGRSARIKVAKDETFNTVNIRMKILRVWGGSNFSEPVTVRKIYDPTDLIWFDVLFIRE